MIDRFSEPTPVHATGAEDRRHEVALIPVFLIPKMASQEASLRYKIPNSQFPVRP
eukprot:COSAG02_NODE_41534_length_393_cov_1.316327_1_plen_54_part_01